MLADLRTCGSVTSMLVVTGAFLADRAGVIDGNLGVWGGMASSRSPRLAISRAKYTLTIGNSAMHGIGQPVWRVILSQRLSR
jgi:hypothetical protein